MSRISKPVSILGKIGRLSGGTMVTRVTGMFREMIMAFVLGSGPAMDAFVVAFTLPNLLRRIIGEKVMESALIPVYRTATSEGQQERADALSKSILLCTTGLSAVLMGAGFAITPSLVRFFAPGFDLQTHELAVTMTRIMFPLMILISVVAFFGALMIAHERFGVYGIVPAIFNVSMIAVVFFGVPIWGPNAAAIGVLVGGIMECVLVFLFLPPEINLRGHGLPLRDKQVKRVGQLTVPIIFETILDKSVVLVDRRLASVLTAGSISSLGYAFRLLQLPYGVLALAISRVYYPLMVDACKDVQKFARHLGAAIRFIWLTMIPCTVLIIIFRNPIVRVIYRHGAFEEHDVAMTGAALACYGVGIVGMGIIGVVSRAFHSMQDTKTPVIVSVILTILNVILNYILVRTSLKHAGLALASSIAYSISAYLLFTILHRRLIRTNPGVDFSFDVTRSFLQCTTASAVAGVLCQSILVLLQKNNAWTTSLITIAAGSVFGLLAYAAILKLMKFKLDS